MPLFFSPFILSTKPTALGCSIAHGNNAARSPSAAPTYSHHHTRIHKYIPAAPDQLIRASMSGTEGDTAPPQKESSHDDSISRNEHEHQHQHKEHASLDALEGDEEKRKRLEASARLENPLHGLSAAELAARGEAFCAKHGLGADESDVRAFRIGAVIAGMGAEAARQVGGGGSEGNGDKLTEDERQVLEREVTHKWHNPRMMYAVIVICSLCAAVQGMDETVVNGAQAFYKEEFGIAGTDPKCELSCRYPVAGTR